MNDLTASEVFEKQEVLEREAATLLGKMLFEFGRLEVDLSLCVVWVDEGRRLETLTRQTSGFTFHKKLDFLADFVSGALPKGSKRHSAYITWLAEAHKARLQRNELVHGRWGVDAARECVVNVIGIPTSPNQREVHYSLDDLKSVLAELKRLQMRLNELRNNWPL